MDLYTLVKGKADASAPTVPIGSPQWPSDTVAREGSGGVSDYLAANPYSIAYVDSGHGHKLGLSEIELKNAAGKYLSSKEADIGSVTSQITLPAADASWGAVSLMNKAGDSTWPITTFSYLYIRKDLTSLGRSGAAVKAFAEFVLSPEGQSMVSEFGFTGVPDNILAIANAGLKQLKLSADATEYKFEDAGTTQKGAGMMPFVISGKRQSYADYERGTHAADISTIKTQIADLRHNEVVQLHGSGTTNPQKFFWKAMDILEERAMVPMSMTYRAVGSGTGQYEFIGASNTPAYTPWNHFGSGDIPVSNADFNTLTGAGKDFIHVPFQLGAISFFHSVPTSVGKINLDAARRPETRACLLARKRRIRLVSTMFKTLLVISRNPATTASTNATVTGSA